MYSETKFTPVPYITRQYDINLGNTKYNGRVNLEEPENPDLVIDTNLNNVEKSMEILITFLQNKYKINFKK